MSAADFYATLIQHSQPRPGFLAERERWLRGLTVEGREEVLFEFEMLLRGIERYFNLHNLPLEQPGRPVVTRDFRPELADVRDAISHASRQGRVLLDPPADQKLVFRRYIETQLADDRTRRALLEEELDQNTPQESLFVLRLALDALRTLIDHLLKLEVCSYTLFSEVGTLALREIVLNPYFRPFRPLEFRIEYDRIKSVLLLEALRELDEPARGPFTVALLALFRMLHYLSYVGPGGEVPAARARVVLALVRSESITLINHLRSDVAEKVTEKRLKAGALKAAKAIATQAERIGREILAAPADEPRASLEAAVAFTALFRDQIVLLARVIAPGLGPDGLFEKLTAPARMAERLRKDLWAFADLCRTAEKAFRLEEPGEEGEAALASLRAYVGYFHDVSYQLLRYDDYAPFDRFVAILLELPHLPEGPLARARLADDCKQFAQTCQTVFLAVGRRADLKNKDFPLRDGQKLAARFRGG